MQAVLEGMGHFFHAHIVLYVDVSQTHFDYDEAAATDPHIPGYPRDLQSTAFLVVVVQQDLRTFCKDLRGRLCVQFFVLLELSPLGLTAGRVENIRLPLARLIVVHRQHDLVVYILVDARSIVKAAGRFLID